MINSSIQTLLKEVEHLTRAEKIELLNSLTIQLQDPLYSISSGETERETPETDLNLADFFQNSPLVAMDIDLTRQVDIERHEIEL
jgi:hypothetical protein